MAVNVATLVARLEADIRDFDRDMRTANKRLDQMEGKTRKANKGFGNMANAIKGVASLAAVSALKRLGQEMVTLAIDAEEAGSAFKTTFGPAVDQVQEFVDEFANKAGFADFELQQLLATTGNVVQGLGATEQVSADLSERMATLAGDVASFSNAAGGAPAVLKALQSALTGEREALKTYGIVISEAEVQQRALMETGKTHADELTRLEKAQATVSLAFERAGKAVGDLDRTQTSAANSLRRLQAELKEAKAVAGRELIPVLNDLLPLLRDLIPILTPIAGLLKGVAGGFTAIARVGQAMIGVFKKSERSASDLWLALSVLEESGFKTEDTIQNVALVLGYLAEEGSLTTEAIEDLQAALGATDSEMRSAVSQVEDKWIPALDNSEEATADLIAATEGLFEVQNTASGAVLGYQYALRNQYIPATEDATTATLLLRDALDQEISKLQEADRQARIATDPIFRLSQSYQTVVDAAETYNAVASDVAASEEDVGLAAQDLLTAFQDYQYAQDLANTTMDDAKPIIDDLAGALGIASDNFWDFIEASRQLPDSVVIPQYALQYINPQPVQSFPQMPDIVGKYGIPVPGRQMGGSVQSGSPYIVGEQGPELFVPNQSGTIEPDVGTNVTVNMTVQDDFRDPAAARRIIRELAQELEAYERETVS